MNCSKSLELLVLHQWTLSILLSIFAWANLTNALARSNRSIGNALGELWKAHALYHCTAVTNGLPVLSQPGNYIVSTKLLPLPTTIPR